ncbi:type II toxin-antitoxin system RelE/ParE family toxin [Gemmatimonadota bacterium]
MKVLWTLQAVDDLTSIRDYIARDSQAYARLITEQLFASVGQLAKYPDSGRIVPERNSPEIRELIRAPYRIIYRRSFEAVAILTIHHSARQLPGQIPGENTA